MVKIGVYHQYLALMNYFLNKSVISKTYATKHGFDNRNSENFYSIPTSLFTEWYIQK